MPQQPARKHTPALLVRHPGAQVIHEGEARASIAGIGVPKLDSRQALHRLVSIVRGRNQSKRCAVVDGDGLPIESVSQEDVPSKEVLKQHSSTSPILTA